MDGAHRCGGSQGSRHILAGDVVEGSVPAGRGEWKRATACPGRKVGVGGTGAGTQV